uniref:Selenoprotein K n=7 Tax=Neoaves TaxID=3078114 RepID=A0A8C0BG89_9AVES
GVKLLPLPLKGSFFISFASSRLSRQVSLKCTVRCHTLNIAGFVSGYVTGQVLDNQSRAPWRLSSITDFFWSIADFVVLFFQSIIQPDLRRRGYTSSSYSGYNDGRGPPAHPRRRMGRINHWGGGPSPPPMAGGG